MSIPNLVTLTRLILVPAIITAALSGKIHLAALLFVFAAATDWIDGYLARRLIKISDLGRLLDPLVDRILIVSVLAIFIIKDLLPLSIVLVVILRDILVLLGSWFLKAKGREIEVTFLGKLSTALIMISVPLVLTGHAIGAWTFYIAALFSVISFLDYLLKISALSKS
ncbi:MAG: CDP-diacylglycerol--glycerol-3-phosphate 3-phosphatidyltransferase [Actinomycetota bacterium]|nr:CDP-diacylglycerol--glycerol-3-phosphate 3-phosphatidyltransferase [Actinomycetota bacterium]